MAILRSTDAIISIEDASGTQVEFQIYAENFNYTRNSVIVDIGGTSNLNAEKIEVGGAENMLNMELNLDTSIASFMFAWIMGTNAFSERTFFLYPNKKVAGQPQLTGEVGVSTWDWTFDKADRQMMTLDLYINSPVFSIQ